MKHIINIFHGNNEMKEHVVGTPVIKMFLGSEHKRDWLRKWADTNDVTGYLVNSLQKEFDGIRQNFLEDDKEKEN